MARNNMSRNNIIRQGYSKTKEEKEKNTNGRFCCSCQTGFNLENEKCCGCYGVPGKPNFVKHKASDPLDYNAGYCRQVVISKSRNYNTIAIVGDA